MSTRDHLARGTPGYPAVTCSCRRLSGPRPKDGEIRRLMTYCGVMAHLMNGAAQ